MTIPKTITTRFAPTTSGRAHPGTLAAALLARLDAYVNGARFVLRMEDIDPSSVRDEFRVGLMEDLEWFGLEWDDLVWQSVCRPAHEELLDILAEAGKLYACSCSRTTVAKAGIPSAAGGFVYPGTCRDRVVSDWRSCRENIRVNCGGISISLMDESGLDLSQNIDRDMGDPLVVRRDGTVTYQLAATADDHFAHVNRIVRGKDIASSTATQVALRQCAGWAIPTYRHHLLLLEPRGEKFAKFHGAVGAHTLRQFYSADELRGIIAGAIGIHPLFTGSLPHPDAIIPPVTMQELRDSFSWDTVLKGDQVLDWTGSALLIRHP